MDGVARQLSGGAAQVMWQLGWCGGWSGKTAGRVLWLRWRGSSGDVASKVVRQMIWCSRWRCVVAGVVSTYVHRQCGVVEGGTVWRL